MRTTKIIAAGLAALFALLAGGAWYMAAQMPVVGVGGFWDVGGRPEDLELNSKLKRASVWNGRAALLSSVAALFGAISTIADVLIG